MIRKWLIFGTTLTIVMFMVGSALAESAKIDEEIITEESSSVLKEEAYETIVSTGIDPDEMIYFDLVPHDVDGDEELDSIWAAVFSIDGELQGTFVDAFTGELLAFSEPLDQGWESYLASIGVIEDETDDQVFEKDSLPIPMGNWHNNIVSEAFYSLNIYRTGGSNVSYHGWAMSDWPYVESDRDADQRISSYVGGCSNRGEAGGYRWMWDDGWKKCHKGGHCKFFGNLILYRCSYGWGGGQHLVLPHGYSYATEDVHRARPGWIIQANGTGYGPHTAIVVAVYPGGLDVVDANWVGSEDKVYRFLIARHFLSWGTLSAWNFRAHDPVARPTLITQGGPRTRCY